MENDQILRSDLLTDSNYNRIQTFKDLGIDIILQEDSNGNHKAYYTESDYQDIKSLDDNFNDIHKQHFEFEYKQFIVVKNFNSTSNKDMILVYEIISDRIMLIQSLPATDNSTISITKIGSLIYLFILEMSELTNINTGVGIDTYIFNSKFEKTSLLGCDAVSKLCFNTTITIVPKLNIVIKKILVSTMLVTGDVVEVTADMKINVNVNGSVMYDPNSDVTEGIEGIPKTIAVEIGNDMPYLEGTYVVYETSGCPKSVFQNILEDINNAYRVFCTKINDSKTKIDFYQAGDFPTTIKSIRPIGKMTLIT